MASATDMETESEKLHVCADGLVYEIESVRNVYDEEDIETKICVLKEFTGHNVTQILSRHNRNVAMTLDGVLWTWGQNQFGGLFKTQTPRREFRVRDVALGYDHLIILTRGGQVLSAGDNTRGQLGRVTININELKEVVIPDREKNEGCVGVAAGFYHSFVWTRTNVFGFGYNYCCQLGLKYNGIQAPDCPIPTKLSFFSGKYIQDVQAGDNFSGVLSEGYFYVFGTFLIYRGFQTFTSPRPLFGKEKIDNFACGSGHVVIKKNNKAYVFGQNTNGQLGKSSYLDGMIPREVSFQRDGDLMDVVDVGASRNSTLIQTKRGVYVCGSISDGTENRMRNLDENWQGEERFKVSSRQSLLLWQSSPQRETESDFLTQRVGQFDHSRSLRLFSKNISRHYWFFNDEAEIERFTDDNPSRVQRVTTVLRILACEFFQRNFDTPFYFLSSFAV